MDDKYLQKKEAVTSFFSNNKDKFYKLKQLIKEFNISKENTSEIEELRNILNELKSEGVLWSSSDKSSKYIYAESLLKCKYRTKSSKFGFAVTENGEEIHIASEVNTVCAMNGDDVLVRIVVRSKDPSRKSEGEIIKILNRNTKTLIGRLDWDYYDKCVVPIDTSFPPISLAYDYSDNGKVGDLVEVEITKYPTFGGIAQGRLVKVIGSTTDARVYVNALSMSYGLDEMLNFNELVEFELQLIPDSVKKSELVGRVDRTAERTYTVDADDAMDLDDAVSIKKLPNGNYMLSVYIADVSHYVKEGTGLNEEAIARGTSIYIPGTVIPMLPKKLSNGICSLNAGEERLALGVDMEINAIGEVVSNDIFKAVIIVDKKMSYDKVYKVLINEDEAVLKEYEAYKDDLFLMRELAEILNKKRMREGSINFDIPETKIVLDDEGNVVDIKPHEITIANNIIEEFMLITNMTVAKKFYFLGVPFIYRIHEKPDEEKLRDLNEILAMYKKRIKKVKDIHPKALSDMLEGIEDESEKKIISDFALRTLKLARYSSECTGHFGLAAKYYCHFTSPIRRYPDLFIHRMITKYLDNNCKFPEEEIPKYLKKADKYAKSSSDMEKNATTIERDFDDLYMAIYMSKYVGERFEATISSVASFGIFVKLDNTVEGFVSFNNINDWDYYIYDEKKHILVGEMTGRIFKVGDRVKVELNRVDITLKQIDFMMV